MMLGTRRVEASGRTHDGKNGGKIRGGSGPGRERDEPGNHERQCAAQLLQSGQEFDKSRRSLQIGVQAVDSQNLIHDEAKIRTAESGSG